MTKKQIEENNENWSFLFNEQNNYLISNLGNLKNKKGKIIKGCVGRNGYLTVYIKGKSLYLHRLVAQTFIPNPNNLPQVNHKDGNKLNNCVNNLEWCTQANNIKHAFRTGLMSSLYKPVYQYDLEGNYIRSWASISEATECVGVPFANISYCCEGKVKTSAGYIWSYERKRINPEDHKRGDKSIPIYQYKKVKLGIRDGKEVCGKGELLNKFKNADEAAKKLGIKDKSNLHKAAKGERSSAGGYCWSYSADEEQVQESNVKFESRYGKIISQYDLDGNFIAQYSSLPEAQEKTNISKKGISAAALRNNHVYKGFIWKYE